MSTPGDGDGSDREADAADLRPWTIKSVPMETRRKANEAAARQDVTMAEWIGQAVTLLADRQACDGIIPPGRPEADRTCTEIDLPALSEAINAAVAATEAAGGTVPKALGRDYAALVRCYIRSARGLPQRQTPRRTIAGNRQTRLIEGTSNG